MKMYIAIKDWVPTGHALNVAAHAGLIGWLAFQEQEDTQAWLKTSFKKVTCMVTDEEFDKLKEVEYNKEMNRKSVTNQAGDCPNDESTATSRENAAPAPHKEPASGELAAALCSASLPYKYEPQRVSLVIGNELITITVEKTQEYKDKIIRADKLTKMLEAINSGKNQNWYSSSKES